MDIVKYITDCLNERNMTFTKLAELTGQSQPNLANKVKRNNFKTEELEQIAAALNAKLEIRFIDNETGRPFFDTKEEKNPLELLNGTLEKTNFLLESLIKK